MTDCTMARYRKQATTDDAFCSYSKATSIKNSAKPNGMNRFVM